MNKVELEAKLESLTDEINFLRSIYEEVRHKQGCLLIPVLALQLPAFKPLAAFISITPYLSIQLYHTPDVCGPRHIFSASVSHLDSLLVPSLESARLIFSVRLFAVE